jgi:hypothetical protein
LINDESINVNKTSVEDLVTSTAKELFSYVERWAQWNPDVCYLESQPLGQMARNVKTKTLSHIIQSLLIAKNIPVKFVSPKLKLCGIPQDGIKTYSQNKKFAVESVITLLKQKDQKWCEWFQQLKGKKDDLADALLQAYYGSLIKEKKPRSKTKRAKIDSHEKTEKILSVDLEM